MAPLLSGQLRGFKPTKTFADLATRVIARQTIVTVTVTSAPTQSTESTTLSGGAIAGIVIGSIVGTLLLVWIIRSCMNLGGPAQQEKRAWYDDVEPTRRTSHSHHHQGGGHRHSHSRSRRGSVDVRGVAAVPVVVRDGRDPSRSPRRPSATYVVQNNRGRSRGGYYAS